MQHSSADVLILRSVPRGDNDRLVSALHAEMGRIFVLVKGASSKRREAAATEPYVWCNMELYRKNGVTWLKSASVIEPFAGLRFDVDKLFLAAYIADVVCELSDEGTPAGEILPLTLNTYHVLSRTQGEMARIKAAFEMRAACIAGFTPDLVACESCGCEVNEDAYLNVMNGSIVCRSCFERAQNALPVPTPEAEAQRRLLMPLDGSALSALRFVCTADPKRVFAFRLTDDACLARFCAAAEAYLLNHLERGFESLQNYKRMARNTPST